MTLDRRASRISYAHRSWAIWFTDSVAQKQDQAEWQRDAADRLAEIQSDDEPFPNRPLMIFMAVCGIPSLVIIASFLVHML